MKQTAFYKSELFRRIIEGNPIVLIDVGARGGMNPKWRPLKSVVKIIGFEPDENECRTANEKAGRNQVCLPIALFNRKGKVSLNLTRNPSCCSILAPNYALIDRFLAAEELEITGTVEVNCSTLDDVMKTTDAKSVDFIKLDTQGSELQILQGAESVLSKYCVFGIEVEVEFSPLYRDQPLFADVDSFLRDRGFALFDISLPLGRKIRKTVPDERGAWRGQGLWTDALYFRDFVSSRSHCPGELGREAAAKTIAIAELHGFGDFALELLDYHASKSSFSDSECGIIRRMLLSTRGGRFRPEHKLCGNIKYTAGEFLHDRFPSIHNLIVRNITRHRGY